MAVRFLTLSVCCLLGSSVLDTPSVAQTISLWLFDEPLGLYPSSVLENSSDNDYPMVLGQGGKIVAGRFGNALKPDNLPPIDYPIGPKEFGLGLLPPAKKGLSEPMTWRNAKFAALMTSGENHLRKEVGFVNPTSVSLNLGDFDWTVELWYKATRKAEDDGVILEIGTGPHQENNQITRLLLNKDRQSFTLTNTPSGTIAHIPSNLAAVTPQSAVPHEAAWSHLAFVYSSAEQQVRHFVNGSLQPLPEKCSLESLTHGPESYLSVGRDGSWERPLPGCIDELRISKGQVYRQAFDPPESFALGYADEPLLRGPPPLFGEEQDGDVPIMLGSSKHLFIDDAMIAKLDRCTFVVNPPIKRERVMDRIEGTFRKHLTVVEDDEGVIRIYNAVEKDFLAVRTSRDGIHFEVPATGHQVSARRSNVKKKNVVIPEMVGGLGNPFIDPNGPPEERWKYFSDYHRRGIYLYTSPDGYHWTRNKSATLPFRSGTQSCTFYDDQRQCYVAYHRSGIFHTPAGGTQRSSVVTEHKNLRKPIPFRVLDQQAYLQLRKTYPLRSPLPWYLDNGPLTPGGFGMEFPHRFDAEPEDPVGTDIYITKAQKYPWAPDTFLAFPVVYFHYWPDGPVTRAVLSLPAKKHGSGPLETQLSVSRNGIDWHRYPRPTYVGIGRHAGRDVVTAYIAQGMVRRGDEIWQYYFGETQYHSPHVKDPAGRGVYRLVQRLDGFVSIDSPYDQAAHLITRAIVFQGNRLLLNIDTDAVGYAQVGFLDEHGEPIEGFSVDDCVYINGDFIRGEVEWLGKGKDVSTLAGKVVQIEFRMRGSKLYAMQFVDQ